jgi:hypothetical protein
MKVWLEWVQGREGRGKKKCVTTNNSLKGGAKGTVAERKHRWRG